MVDFDGGISKIRKPPASLAGEALELNYDSSEELDLQGRYMLCLVFG